MVDHTISLGSNWDLTADILAVLLMKWVWRGCWSFRRVRREGVVMEERVEGRDVGRVENIVECLQMEGFISPLMPRAPARSRWRGPSWSRRSSPRAVCADALTRRRCLLVCTETTYGRNSKSMQGNVCYDGADNLRPRVCHLLRAVHGAVCLHVIGNRS